jgi:hypothetical protein
LSITLTNDDGSNVEHGAATPRNLRAPTPPAPRAAAVHAKALTVNAAQLTAATMRFISFSFPLAYAQDAARGMKKG